MDFARRQLEKYGWADGKGLGKHENGISEALKPKLKRSVAGVGHDAAAEFNEHWWTTLYDKAAANVDVKEKDGVTKKIKTKDNQEFVITNSTWKLNKKQKDTDNEEQYSDYFVRTAVLTNGASNVERVRESDSEDDEKKDVFKMTDEELFAKCEGRTAHKGARHGLKATGKLARIAQQEALLLSQSKYSGYSHAKKLKEQVEDINLNSDSDTNERKKKKKKRKRCNSNEKPELHTTLAESEEIPLPDNNVTDDDNVASVLKEENVSRKSKKSKKKKIRHIEVIPEEDEDVSKPKKKKKGTENTEVPEIMETNTVEDMTIAEEENSMKKSKKKKKKAVES
ncbi:G patch domain-containing protein 4 [Helicoverpa zea]|uniref:G patch domain-containing protein 4 n=1 Tax=Helicoverpa zea TaxID=7113 RepID=UPI001F56EF37|nr:G patch domain-containing protein 4 [Helicoverpa zea]